MDAKAIVTAGLKAGNSKMQILTDMIRADNALDLGSAGTIYKEVGTEQGYLLDKTAKEKLVKEIGAQYTIPEVPATDDAEAVPATFNRTAGVNALVERAHLSKTVAVNHLKTYCAENGLVFPNADRTSRDMNAVKEYYKTYFAETTREAMETALIANFAYTKKNVGQAFLKIGKELKLIAGGTAPGRSELAAWFTVGDNVKGEKKEVIKRLMEDTDIAKATAETRYGMYLFAVEYHKLLTPVTEGTVSV